ncbi:MAG: hypothetical protein GYA47_09200 [Desulfovibrio sp.]|nr:hypothetical protein [Desulfovibrio sp.]
MKRKKRIMMLMFLATWSCMALAVFAMALTHVDVASRHDAMSGVSLLALGPQFFGRHPLFPAAWATATVPGRVGSPCRDINHSTPRSFQ